MTSVLTPGPPRHTRCAGLALALVLTAVVLAVVCADGWRWHLGVVGDVAGSQSLWGLGSFGFALGMSAGRVRRGLAVGAAFGGVAIGAYYLYEWLAYDLQAATSQLAASGIFWVPAALLGGGVCGVLGALAARPPGDRRLDPCALGWSAMAAVPLGEVAFVSPQTARFADSLVVPFAVMVAVAVALLALGVRRAGWRRMSLSLAVVAVVAPVLGAAFVSVEWHLGYLTL